MAELTQFDVRSAARIARTVQVVEGATPPTRPLTFEAIFPPQIGRKSFMVATFTGSWETGASKVITFLNSTHTAVAVNLLRHIPSPSSPGPNASDGNCVVGRDGTAWYLAHQSYRKCESGIGSVDLTEEGYEETASAGTVVSGNAGNLQVLCNSGGCMSWVSLKKRRVLVADTDGQGLTLDSSGLNWSERDVWLFDDSASIGQYSLSTTTCTSA